MHRDILRIIEAAKKLNLANLANGNIKLKENPDKSNLEYLADILSLECEMRKSKVAHERKKASKLPDMAFDINRAIDGVQKQIKTLENLEWIDVCQNLIIIGKCETGKTALASHLGMLAIDAGEKVSYMTISKMLEILAKKDKSDRYARMYRNMAQASVIIVDDVMYARIPDDDLFRLYHAITGFNHTHSIVIITNREMSRWSDGVEDSHMVETFVSRLTANSQIIRL